MSKQICNLLHKQSCKIIAVFFLFFSQSTLFSQVDTSVYYPLAKGNKWEYFNRRWFPEYYERVKLEVENDTLLNNGKIYSKIKETTIFSNEVFSWYIYQRVENNNRVYEYIDSTKKCGIDENLLFDFSAPEKKLWPICGYYGGYNNYMGILEKGIIDFSSYKNLQYFDFYYRIGIYESSGRTDTLWWVLDADNYHRVLKGIGIIRYREELFLQACLINGEQFGAFTAVKEDKSLKPSSFRLYPAYPNPFNPVTKIEFTIPQSGYTRLEVFDVLGRKVKDLVSRELTAGRHTVEFNGANLTSGIYYYRLTSSGFSDLKKVILLK